MAKDNAQSSFQRGVMSLLILSLLDQGGHVRISDRAGDRGAQRQDH